MERSTGTCVEEAERRERITAGLLPLFNVRSLPLEGARLHKLRKRNLFRFRTNRAFNRLLCTSRLLLTTPVMLNTQRLVLYLAVVAVCS